jgi:hypothetical protein
MSDYKTLQSWMRPFPEPKDVFAGDVKEHAKHLQPVLSIEASQVDPTWEGWFHFVIPREPYCGRLGDFGEDYYEYSDTNICLPDFISFQRHPDGRLQFLGDWRFFMLGPGPITTEFAPNLDVDFDKSHYDALVERYKKTELSLNATKAFFKQHGILNQYGHADSPDAWLSYTGYLAFKGHWLRLCPDAVFPNEEDDGEGPVGEGSFVHLLTPDGRRFRHVGLLPASNYIEGGPNNVSMFYDPVASLVLFSLVWQY